jgi:hypothetical protein
VTKEDFIKYADKSFVLDCPKMTLRQCGTDTPFVFEGSGSIYQGLDGALVLKMFAPNATSKESWLLFDYNITDIKSGKIMPEHVFFDLTAYNIKGECWTSKHCYPHSSSGTDGMGIVFSGKLANINNETTLKNTKELNPQIFLYFKKKVDFPCNVVTTEEKTVNEKKWISSKSLNIAQFDVEGSKFSIQEEGEWLVVSAKSNGRLFPNNFYMRCCEALSFVFFKEFTPAIIVKIASGNKNITFLGYNDDKNEKGFYKPVPARNIINRASFWDLFSKYLEHITPHDRDYWHDLSGHIMSVIRAENASMDVQILTLAVAIEGVLKITFKDSFEPPEDIDKQLKILKNLIKNSSDLNDNFKNRINGMAGNMKQLRPKDILKHLVDEKLVRQDLSSVWNNSRNSHVHADSQKPENFEKHYSDCLSLYTLFNELLFLSVGYEGDYTDYSTLGFPTIQFTKKLVEAQ